MQILRTELQEDLSLTIKYFSVFLLDNVLHSFTVTQESFLSIIVSLLFYINSQK